MKKLVNNDHGMKPNILVAGAHSIGALGVIRSLGRAGYRVHAVAASEDAIGLKSNFAETGTRHPAPESPAFEEWIKAFIHKYNIEMIIPGGPISPNNPALKTYSHLFPTGTKKISNLTSKGQKYEMFDALLAGDDSVRENLPPILLINFEERLPSNNELTSLGSPVFIKLDGSHSIKGKGDQVIRVQTVHEALQRLELLQNEYRRAVVQGFVAGCGVGVFLLRWNNEIKARFMHRRIHEMPHTGGASSLRESWWNDEIADDAEKKLSFIDWEGVAMVEYRWEPATGKFFLMEMNLRFWGSIHLALYAGVDFPKLLADCFFGNEKESEQAQSESQPVLGLKCRNTIPFEIGYLVSLWRDPNVSVLRKFHSIWEAICLSLNFRIKNDLFFPGDRKLFWYRLSRFLIRGE